MKAKRRKTVNKPSDASTAGRVIRLTAKQKESFDKILRTTRTWSSKHQWEIGVAEMAAGAGLIALGVNTGVIVMGKDIVGTAVKGYNPAALKTAGLGGAGGAIAGLALGGIGVATGGMAIGIPALLVMTGAAGVFGSAGYTGSDVIYRFIHKVSSTDFIVGSSLLVVGTALLVDGARRIAKDSRVQTTFSQLVKGVLHLANLTAEVVCQNMKDFNEYTQKVFMKAQSNMPDMKDILGGGASAAAFGATGVAVGGAIAAGNVSVFGSSALGGLALSLGLISAPVWPVIVAAAAGTAVGALAWTGVKKFRNA